MGIVGICVGLFQVSFMLGYFFSHFFLPLCIFPFPVSLPPFVLASVCQDTLANWKLQWVQQLEMSILALSRLPIGFITYMLLKSNDCR